MTCTGNAANGTWAAVAMPSKRWRTTASESSAGNSSTGPAVAHGELPQTGGAGSDADRHVQRQEAFTALGFPAQNADGLLGPKFFDQPLSLRTAAGELAGALDGQWVHGFWAGLGSSAKTSK